MSHHLPLPHRSDLQVTYAPGHEIEPGGELERFVTEAQDYAFRRGTEIQEEYDDRLNVV